MLSPRSWVSLGVQALEVHGDAFAEVVVEHGLHQLVEHTNHAEGGTLPVDHDAARALHIVLVHALGVQASVHGAAPRAGLVPALD
eukprot:7585254-Alexandrium_andersonii.AAC.1